jgi:hypothetical protein
MSRYLHVGGLIAVGFDSSESYLLAISHSGRGVFSTSTWERVARDDRLAYPENGHGTGIGPIDGAKIPVVEMYWQTCGQCRVESQSGKIELLCESSGILPSSVTA